MKKQNNYYVEEREIDVKRMMIQALTHWRFILTIALAGAVFLEVKQYRADVVNAKNSIQAQIDAANTPVETIESLEEQLPEFDVQNVWYAYHCKVNADGRMNYMKESVYMNLDAYNENVSFLSYHIDSEQPAAILGEYSNYLTSEELAETLNADLELSIENKYLMELYRMSSSDNFSRFTVRVCADSEEECEELATALDRALHLYIEKEKSMNEDASLILDSRMSKVVMDTDLASLKSNFSAEINTNLSLYNAYYNGFTDMQKSLYELLMERHESESVSFHETEASNEETQLSGDASQIDTTINVRPSIKMILAGFAAGAIIAYAICALKYVASREVHGIDEVKYLFGIPVFGTIRTVSFGKKKAGAAVDTAIDKLNFGRKKYLNTEQQMQMVSSNLLLNCKNAGITEIFLTGSELEHIPQNCVTELTARLGEQGIHVTVGNSILYDAQSLLRMAETGNAVFIEIEEKSKCEEIAKELNLCIQNRIQIAGMILTRN